MRHPPDRARKPSSPAPQPARDGAGLGFGELSESSASPGHDFGRLPAPVGFEPLRPSVLQARAEPGTGGAGPNLRPRGPGQSLPDNVRSKMESSFGHDFSGVRVHQGPQASSIGAVAFTQGSNIHFAPGSYQPHSGSGQKLLGHELTHVVQQRQGRVKAPPGAGVPINDSPSLEREADVAGARAARGSS